MINKHSTIKNSGHRSIAIPIIKNRLPHKKNIQKIAGCLSTKDAAELKAIIEQGCDRSLRNY
jgi:hypothetical protein